MDNSRYSRHHLFPFPTSSATICTNHTRIMLLMHVDWLVGYCPLIGWFVTDYWLASWLLIGWFITDHWLAGLLPITDWLVYYRSLIGWFIAVTVDDHRRDPAVHQFAACRLPAWIHREFIPHITWRLRSLAKRWHPWRLVTSLCSLCTVSSPWLPHCVRYVR